MLQVTRWRPDTCNCALVYEWDDALDENTRTHSINRIEKACSAHQAIGDKVRHYDTVLEENQRKNILLGNILENIPSAVMTVIQDDGSSVKQLKRGREYRFSFDANRKLIIELVGFTQLEKTAVQTLANNLFPDKVKLNG